MSKYIEETDNKYNKKTQSKICCSSCKKHYLVDKGMEWKKVCISCYMTSHASGMTQNEQLEKTQSKPLFRIVENDDDLIPDDEKKN